jgi:hypothetical protein
MRPSGKSGMPCGLSILIDSSAARGRRWLKFSD